MVIFGDLDRWLVNIEFDVLFLIERDIFLVVYDLRMNIIFIILLRILGIWKKMVIFYG